MEKYEKIKQINQEIKNLEKIRNAIQDECRHKETIIKFDSNNIPKVMCCDCEKNLRYPSREKLEVFLEGK